MATFKKFEEIEAWQKSRHLTKRIYRISRTGEFARDFGLKDQIRRAAVSIMSNIAERVRSKRHRRIHSIPGHREGLGG